ncbi:MAG: PilZ domain-containing protein [Deltaproteobacteria bacterium]|nr:PilZ domain-containing protein [Deltaproteobacteria bacterium]MBW2340368.1 PilZ domain-containing protein [Deltaproteobacteria bacterium]
MGKEKRGKKERRHYPRLQSLNLVSYINKEGEVQKSGVAMAKTTNISAAGAGVEVYQAVEADSRIEMEIAIKERIVAVQGKVIHSQAQPNGHWIIGIEFDHVQEDLAKELS